MLDCPGGRGTLKLPTQGRLMSKRVKSTREVLAQRRETRRHAPSGGRLRMSTNAPRPDAASDTPARSRKPLPHQPGASGPPRALRHGVNAMDPLFCSAWMLSVLPKPSFLFSPCALLICVPWLSPPGGRHFPSTSSPPLPIELACWKLSEKSFLGCPRAALVEALKRVQNYFSGLRVSGDT